MKCLISLFLVITIPIFGVIYPVNSQFGPGGQDQFSNLGVYGDDFRGPVGQSGFGQGLNGYPPQFHGHSQDPSGRSRGPYNGGGYLDMSNLGYGPYGSESIGPWPPGIPGSRGYEFPSRDSGYGPQNRHGRPGDDSGGRRRRRHPGRPDSTAGRRNNGRKRRRPRSSSEESSGSSESRSEEVTRTRGGSGRNRYGNSGLGLPSILDPATYLHNGRELIERTINAGKDLAHESGNQFNRIGERVFDGIKQNGQKIGNITGAAGQNGTAITIGSFKNPEFVKEFLYNIYRTMSQWGQVLQTLPGNLWRNFQRMMECIGGRITGNKC